MQFLSIFAPTYSLFYVLVNNNNDKVITVFFQIINIGYGITN